jgi:hypothetical protein
VSRGYNERRKRKRREAQAAAHIQKDRRRRRLSVAPAVPILVVVATFVAVGVAGFGGGGASRAEISREVTELLHGIPQQGAVLGSDQAPITLRLYADVECPTVKRFVEADLPEIVERWVRPGYVKLEYRPLETDTTDEEVFFEQEIAGLAAGRQGRMWDFLLTFVREQKDGGSNYASEEVLKDVASQVPNLRLPRWRGDREDPLLSMRVALSVHGAHSGGMRFTPSFQLVSDDHEGARSRGVGGAPAVWKELKTVLAEDVKALGEEALGDRPSLRSSTP